MCGVRWWRESEGESKTDGEWDMNKVRQNAYYRCQECGGEIYDAQKSKMLRLGEWKPTNLKAKAGRRSYHLNSLYSQLGKECSFGALAVKWLECKGSMAARHAFINSTLAETWDDERAVDDAPLFQEDYDIDPKAEGRTTVMAVDVQDNHFWVAVRCFEPPTKEFPAGQSWGLFADRVATIEEVREIQRIHEVENKNVVIDINRYTNKVAKWIVDFSNEENPLDSWRGLWGSDKKGFIHTLDAGQRLIRAWSPVHFRDPHLGTVYASDVNRKAMWVYWANDPIKDTLAVLRFTSPAVFHIPTSFGSHYQRHLNAEIKMTVVDRVRGKTKWFWKQLRRDNHLLDCECMCLVRAMQLGIALMPEETPAAFQRSLALHDLENAA